MESYFSRGSLPPLGLAEILTLRALPSPLPPMYPTHLVFLNWSDKVSVLANNGALSLSAWSHRFGLCVIDSSTSALSPHVEGSVHFLAALI